nr:MAG TPA: hypothetical protein [Bacteriophage sp.]
MIIQDVYSLFNIFVQFFINIHIDYSMPILYNRNYQR